MKKHIIILTIALIVSVSSFAQHRSALQKGSITTGGKLGLSFGSAKHEETWNGTTEQSSYSGKSIALTPSLGYFVANGFAMGLSVDYTSSKFEDDEDYYCETSYLVGPYMRYYVPQGVFLHTSVGFGKQSEKGKGWEDEAKKSDFQFGIGYAVFMNDFVAFEFAALYQKTGLKYDVDNGSDKISQNNLLFAAGFSIFLHKRSE
jgi:hypothetical protein